MSLWEYIGAWSTVTKWLYHLNWNANDSSGNGNNWVSTNVTWVWGRLGSWAASFNWSSSRISWTWLNPSSYWTTSFTVSLWAKINSWSWVNNKELFIIKETWSWWNIQFYFNSSWSNINAQPWNWQTNNIYTVTKTFSTWIWYYLTYVRTATTDEIFVDWVSIWKNTHSSFWFSNTWTAYVLWDTWDGNAYTNWVLDEVVIENRAWTAEEIRRYYTYSQGKFAIL